MTAQYFASTPEELLDQTRLLSMSGLEFMTGILEGRLPMPPICGPMNFRLDVVEDGHAVFRGSPTFDHCNPMGSVHGGWYGTLLDSALGCAVMTKVPKGSAYTTLEYKINITRALKPGTEIIAEATTSHSGRSTGVAEGTIRGADDGRLYATGSTTCIIMALNRPDNAS